MITIGIDPHKASLTAAALDANSTLLGQRRLAATTTTADELIAWARRWPVRVWAVEGALGLGHGVAQALVAAGEHVVDVPATLAARARLLGSGSSRKTDLTDGASVASVAIHNPKLSVVHAEDDTTVLRLLSDRRDDIVAQRTRTMNRLQVLLRELVAGGAPRQISTAAARVFLAKVRPMTTTDHQRKRIARQLIDDLRRADLQLKQLAKEIEEAVIAARSSLPEVLGIGFILAAQDHRPRRRHHPLRVQGALRELHRNGPRRGLQRRPSPPSPEPSRQPPAQQRPAHGGDRSGVPGADRDEITTSARSPS